MKILQITASYKPAYIYGGPIMSVAKLCEELVRLREPQSDIRGPQSDKEGKPGLRGPQSDVRVVVYTTLANGIKELPYPSGTVKIVDGVEVHYFKRLTKDHSHFSPALYWKLWHTVKQFDIVQIHAWWNLVSMISCCIALFRGVKVIITPRGTLSNYSFYNRSSKVKRLFHQFIGSWLLNKFDFHVTSEKEAQDTKTLLNVKSINVIPNFVDLPYEKISHFKMKPPKNENAVFKLIFLSRIEQKKGLELLFEALSKLNFQWHLRIAGTGEESYVTSLKLLATTLGIQNRMTWLGMLNREDKFEELHQNDLFVLPSFDENFANVVIESLFAATPVLITENVGLSGYVKEKDLGWVCERNADVLSATIIEAKNTLEQENYHHEYLNETIVADFKEELLVKKYWEMYDKILS